ncbi:gliding motility-associated ABC transporter permease subunit GldF [Tenuifilum thalassicum]|uniref:Gliding motility-associated ABC transporter permease subunit GldF n=1 Tax=Tenuifilum thalassicum TaxID=2590900 RepID=A0A7D3Y009_9BACT|nr:gliding motility-associated ABC transporter permease subunit GldF [Tenuifilum thalassicum]QKG80173.1 gliding motility-associated ABC transporter permease subunit GldF [Tenuifilum thalassicum]
MKSIFIREMQNFFSSLTGYVIAIVFLVLTGLFLWVLPGYTNILDSGYATLDSLFLLAPWLFLFLVPAATMRMFADEKKAGTIELILTRPISDTALVVGKYLASIVLVSIILIPSLIFVYSVAKLGSPVGNLDWAATWGSYIGLFFLAAAYASIGIFTSSLTDNTIVAFLASVALSYLFYDGIVWFAELQSMEWARGVLISLSISEHYESLSRGVIDSRDILYFISFSLVFLLLTRVKLESRKW